MSRVHRSVDTRAVEVLKKNIVKEGLRTSAAYYNQVWARDAFISFLGANMLQDAQLLKAARDTVFTFSKTASPMGQIPNFYDLKSHSPEYGWSGSTDSTAWFIIGLASLHAATDDRTLLGGPLETATNAYRWLRYQDANNSWLIDSPPGADWMDAAVQRTGKTLYNNILFLMATLSLGPLLDASIKALGRQLIPDFKELRRRFSDVFLPGRGSPKRMAAYWPRLSEVYEKGSLSDIDRRYYLHYISFSRIDTRFDTLSNLLCVLSGVAEARTAASILDVIRSRGLSKPFPVRVLDPPYATEGPGFHEAFDSSLPIQHRSGQYAYHNGAVWPFVGGFLVAALYSLHDTSAEDELMNLAKANARLRKGEKVGFNEWLHGRTGKPLGQYGQSWNAGMFVGATYASRGKEMLSFLNG